MSDDKYAITTAAHTSPTDDCASSTGAGIFTTANRVAAGRGLGGLSKEIMQDVDDEAAELAKKAFAALEPWEQEGIRDLMKMRHLDDILDNLQNYRVAVADLPDSPAKTKFNEEHQHWAHNGAGRELTLDEIEEVMLSNAVEEALTDG